jgi:hypothetical protein
MVEVNERGRGPKSTLKLVSGNEAAGALKQHFQYLEGLAW